MRNVTIAATQMACGWDVPANVDRAETLIRRAAAAGARIVLLQELFETPYFCAEIDRRFFDLARPVDGHPTLYRMADLARELGVVLPVSFFERAGTVCFNSLALFDADGTRLALYRKSHIPDAPGYQEKYYFTPGDTGLHVHATRHGRVGIGICWDQWFPELARALVLQGAEILLYPTAIGSEPSAPQLDSRDQWQRVMQGHAAANLVPVVAANRIGRETSRSSAMTFYGSSFITDHHGAKIAEADRETEGVISATIDLDAAAADRTAWGVFRDRRPDLYGTLLGHDGAPSRSRAG
jgi:N-carbamoylputrescine amidase